MHGFIEPQLDMEHTATVDGRRAQRVTLMLRNAKLSIDGIEMLCIVRDVSMTGVRIRAFHPIPAGKACSIELGQGQRLPVEEAWNDGMEAGYAFSEARDLDTLVHEHGPFPKRPIRINLTLPAEIVHWEGGAETVTPVDLCNISQQGGCIQSDRHWSSRQLVRVRGDWLPDPLHAKVLWHHANLHGLVFERTFALADFARLVARMQRLSPGVPARAIGDPV